METTLFVLELFLAVLPFPRWPIPVALVLYQCGHLAAVVATLSTVTSASVLLAKASVVVAALLPAELFPDPEGKVAAKTSLPQDKFPETDVVTTVALLSPPAKIFMPTPEGRS